VGSASRTGKVILLIDSAGFPPCLIVSLPEGGIAAAGPAEHLFCQNKDQTVKLQGSNIAATDRVRWTAVKNEA